MARHVMIMSLGASRNAVWFAQAKSRGGKPSAQMRSAQVNQALASTKLRTEQQRLGHPIPKSSAARCLPDRPVLLSSHGAKIERP